RRPPSGRPTTRRAPPAPPPPHPTPPLRRKAAGGGGGRDVRAAPLRADRARQTHPGPHRDPHALPARVSGQLRELRSAARTDRGPEPDRGGPAGPRPVGPHPIGYL